MNDWALLIVGLGSGGALAWLAASSRASGIGAELRTQIGRLQGDVSSRDQDISKLHQQVRVESEQKVAAETRLSELRASVEEQKRLLEEAKQSLTETFKSLAADTLRGAQQQFLAVAKTEFATVHAEAKGDLETREKAIEGLVQPLRHSLQRYEQQILEMERLRQSAYGSLGQQVQDLQKTAGNLDLALRGQQAQPRGQWGELTLARVLELAGLPEAYVSDGQLSFETEAGRLRPDRIVHFPGGRCIAIDAKAPLEAFLKSVSAPTEEERIAHLKNHCKLVRGHMLKLADKRYWSLLQPAPEIVILFLPGEAFLSAAVEEDEKLVEDSLANRVMLASPATLLAMLRAIEYGWRQEQIAQNAREISNLGKELYDRIQKFTEHFANVGYSLGKAVDSYDAAVGSWQERLLKSARRFKDLGAATGEDIPDIEGIDKTPRLIEVWEPGERA